MKRFIGFVRKEFYHILRDPRTLLILFGMPLAQILLFGYAVTNEIREAKVAIIDPAGTVTSRDLTSRILASGYFIQDHEVRTLEEARRAFRKGNIKLAILYPSDLGQQSSGSEAATIQVLSDATDPNTSNTLVSYINQISASYQQAHAPPGFTRPLSIDLSTEMRYNPELKGVYLFVPGLMAIILMLVSAMMTSISITREREMGNMEILLVSPLAPAQIILGKVIPYILLGMGDALLVLGTGYFVFGVPIVGNLWLLLGECLLFILAALSLGILISTVAKTQQVALMMSLMVLMLPTILLSGFMFPIDNMPLILQVISNAIPARWFIEIVKGIMLQGTGLALLWQETLILCGFTFFFLVVSMRRFKIRLE